MANFHAILAISLCLLALLVNAEPPRYHTSRRNGALRTNIRFLARQETAPAPLAPTTAAPAPTPYPAAGVTPEVPFDLPTETEAAPAAQPDQVYGPPDQTYGPPDQTYGPPEAAEPPVQPDNLYGPPESSAAQPSVAEPESESNAAEASNDGGLASQNLIQPRNRGLRLTALPASQKLAPHAGLVEIIHSEPILVYTLK